MSNLVEICKATPGQIPFTPNTCYKFHSQKKYPKMILLVGGKLFFDINEWEQMIEESRQKQVAVAKGLHSI